MSLEFGGTWFEGIPTVPDPKQIMASVGDAAMKAREAKDWVEEHERMVSIKANRKETTERHTREIFIVRSRERMVVLTMSPISLL